MNTIIKLITIGIAPMINPAITLKKNSLGDSFRWMFIGKIKPFLLSLRLFNIIKNPSEKNNIGASELGKGKPITINLILRMPKRITATVRNIFLLIYNINLKIYIMFRFISQIIFYYLWRYWKKMVIHNIWERRNISPLSKHYII